MADKDLDELTKGFKAAADAAGKFERSQTSLQASIAKTTELLARLGGNASDGADDAKKLEDSIKALLASVNPLHGKVTEANEALKKANELHKIGKITTEQHATAVSELTARHAAAVKSEEALTKARKFGADAARLQSGDVRKLGKSVSEAFVDLRKGGDPLDVLIKQGPALWEVFSTAMASGVGFRGVLAGIGAEVAPVMAALAPLAAPLLAAGAVAVVVGGAVAVTAQQIGKSVGENLDHLNLTEEQLERVKNKGVTMGDVLNGAWKGVAGMLSATFGPALQAVGDGFGKLYQGAVDGVLWLVRTAFQAIGGFTGGLRAAFTALPAAIGDLVYSAVNLAAEGLEKLANGAIGIVNKLIGMANKVAAKFGLPIQLPELDTVSVARLENKYAGAAAGLGKALATGAVNGAAAGAKVFDNLGKQFVENVREARDERVVEEAGKATKAAEAACACATSAQNVTNNANSNTTNNRTTNNRSSRDERRNEGGPGRVVDLKTAEPVSIQGPLEAIKPNIPDKLTTIPFVEVFTTELDNLIARFEAIGKISTNMGAQLEAAFGKPGKALSTLITASADYGAKMADIDRQLKKQNITAEAADGKRTETTLKAYGTMAGAAKGFFKENSDGYKAMQVAEIAFHTIETLNTIKSMALRGADTASAVSGEAAKQAAFSATAYAKTLSSLPFPMNLLAGAAVLAALVQAGAAIKGKPGGGSVPGANDMKTRQDAQGSGSTLGDPKAKSESLEKALTHAQAYENKDLEYGNAMVRSLKSIDDQIGAVASALAKSFGAGGMLSTEGLALGKTGTAATLSNLGFGKSTTRTLQDQGVQFDATTFGALAQGGLSGSTYQQVLENTKKKAFGITTSNKSKVITETGALDPDFLVQVTGLIVELGKGVGEAARAIGSTDFEGLLAGFKVDLGKLSFKDMTGAQIEEALNAIFGKLGDDMAKAAAPAIAEFQKVGEGAFETLVRVARQYEVIDTTLKSVGMQFGDVGLASLAARERLVELVGGLDNLTDQTAFFGEHFLSEDQRLKPVKQSVTDELTRLKLPTDLTRQGFKDKVQSLDLSTQEGAELYAALMALAPAFDKVATAVETTQAAVKEKATSIQDQIDELVMTPVQKLAKSRDAEKAAVEALDISLLPLLKSLWDLQDAADKTAESTAKAAEAQALAKSQSGMLADLLDAQGRTGEAVTLRRQLAYAEIKDPLQQAYQLQIWAAQDAAAKVSAARDVLNQAYQRERDQLQQTKDKFDELSKSLKAFSAGLTDTIEGADVTTGYQGARGRFLETASLARLGNEEAMRRLQADGEAFTAASRDYAATSIDYLRDVGLVRSAVDEAADTAGRQVTIAEQQLEALESSVEGLIDIGNHVVEVRDAILSLQAALMAAQSAGVRSVGGSGVGSGSGSGAGSGPGLSSGSVINRPAQYGAYVGDPKAGSGLLPGYTSQALDMWYTLTNGMAGAQGAGNGGVPADVANALNHYQPSVTTKASVWGIDWALQDAQTNGWKFASGGAFSGGGVVSRATAFPIGLMGEAGPEAIMPLSRTASGALGVRAAGGSSSSDQALINELRSLRAELADLRASSDRIANSNDKMERTLTNVTEGGRAMQTQAAA